MAVLMKGIDVVNSLKEKITNEIGILAEMGITPGLAIVRLGSNPDDLAYEKTLLKRCESMEVNCSVFEFPASIPQDDFLSALRSIDEQPEIDGILLFRPLPKQIDEKLVKTVIRPGKDIDCLNPLNTAKLFEGDESGFYPCTAEAVMELLDFYNILLEGKNVVIIGRSMVVGKPLAMMMLKRNASVTMCHSKTRDLPEICKKAEIVVAAIGKAKFVTADFLAEGSTVIDVGINAGPDGGLCGDVDFESAEKRAAFITPVPGGVGTITSTILVKHVVMAAQKFSGLKN